MMDSSVGTNKLLYFTLVISLYIFLSVTSCDCASPSSIQNTETFVSPQENVPTTVKRAHTHSLPSGSPAKTIAMKAISVVLSIVVMYAIFKGVEYVKAENEKAREAAEKKQKEEERQKKLQEEKLKKARKERKERERQEEEEISAAEEELNKVLAVVDGVSREITADLDNYSSVLISTSNAYMLSKETELKSMLEVSLDDTVSAEDRTLVLEKKQTIYNTRALRLIKLSDPATLVMGSYELSAQITKMMQDNGISYEFLLTDLKTLVGTSVVDDSEKEKYKNAIANAFQDKYGDEYEQHKDTYTLLTERVFNLIKLNNDIAFFNGKLDSVIKVLQTPDVELLKLIKEEQI